MKIFTIPMFAVVRIIKKEGKKFGIQQCNGMLYQRDEAKTVQANMPEYENWKIYPARTEFDIPKKDLP